MTIDTKNLKPAKRYASALIATGNIDNIKNDLSLVVELIFSNDEYKNFFKHPVISVLDKKDTIREIFDGKIDNEVLNLLYVLLDNNRFDITPLVNEVFVKESEKLQNIIHAQVSSVIELDEAQKLQLNKKLNDKLKKQVILDFNIDKEIIGGLTIKIEDNIIDLSLKSKFDKLKKA